MLAHSFILSLPNQLPLPTPPPHMKCYILIIRALIQKGIKINLFITIIHLAIYSAMGEFQLENSVIIEKMQDIPALYKLNACFLQMVYLFTPHRFGLVLLVLSWGKFPRFLHFCTLVILE